MNTALGVYEWLCNAVNGNYPNVPSPIIWGAIAALITAIVYPPIRRRIEAEFQHIHAKLDHVIYHSKDIPPFPKKRP